MTLDYFIGRERQMLVANGVSPEYPKTMSRAKWEYSCEKAYRAVYLEWLRRDPGKIVHVKVENLWNFWVRAENWQKTKLLILMQVPLLGAVTVSLIILLRRRQLLRVKFGVIIILVLWAEHFLVFAWGRFSLDLVPILGLIFGLGVAARDITQRDEAAAGVVVEAAHG